MTELSKERSFGRFAKTGAVWGFVKEGTNSLILLPTTVIMARLLTPAEFGIAAVAYFFLALSSRLTQFGFNAALMRTKELREEHTSSVFVVNLALGALAWGILTALAPVIATFVRNDRVEDVIPVAALTFIISAFGTVPGTLLTRDLRFREVTISDWLGTISNSAVAILLAWNGFGFWSIVYGHLANDVVYAVARLFFARWRPHLRFSNTAIRELFSFGAGVYAKSLLDYLVQNVDNLIVGRLLGVSALGFYDKAFNLVTRMVGRINLSGPEYLFQNLRLDTRGRRALSSGV